MKDIREYSDQYNALARQFMKYCFTDGGNVMISPFSIMLLLSIAADSASGETRKEILKALGDQSGKNEPGRILSRFQETLSGRERVFSSANAVCVRRDFADRVNLFYKDMVLKLYDAQLFSSEHMKQDIDAWVNEKTRGMIRDAAPASVEDALLCLLNAVAFEGEWEDPYEDEDVRDKVFHNADGTDSRVNMLFGCEDVFLEDDDFIGFTKPYRSESGFVYMALLPKKEGSASLSDALERIDFGRLFRSGRQAIVHTVMPEFKFEYEQELKQLCMSLGMEELFGESADFSPVSPDPLMLDSILHKTFIDVNQAGTRAAAVTMAVMVGCAPPPMEKIKKVTLDRPFVFAVVHGPTGIPVFTGVVNHLENAKADPERVKRNLKRNRERNREHLVRYEVSIPEEGAAFDDSDMHPYPPKQNEGTISDRNGLIRGYRPNGK